MNSTVDQSDILHSQARLAVHITPSDVTLDDLNCAAQQIIGQGVQISESVLRNALNPDACVKTLITMGSVAPAEVERMLNVARARLLENIAWLTSERERQNEARCELNQAVNLIMDS